MKDTRQLELSFKDAERKLSGDETRSSRFIVTEPSIQGRLGGVMFGSFGSTYGPTTTHREQLVIANESYKEVAGEIRTLVEVDLPVLRTKLDEAKIPWTTGRPIPDLD